MYYIKPLINVFITEINDIVPIYAITSKIENNLEGLNFLKDNYTKV